MPLMTMLEEERYGQLNEREEQLAKEVTEALGFYFCVSHFEVRWEEKVGKPIIMEVASRTGGDYIPSLLRAVLGYSTWKPLLDYIVSEDDIQKPILQEDIARCLRKAFGD